MYANLKELIDEKLKYANKNGKEAKSCRLRAIARIAILFSKFQRLTADKYKKTVEYKFNREEVIAELGDSNRRAFYFTEQPTKLIYFIRKFQLTFDELTAKDFMSYLQHGLEKKNHYFYALALKHLCRNNSERADVSKHLCCNDIINLIKSTVEMEDDKSQVKSELVNILAYVIGSAPASDADGSFIGHTDLSFILSSPEISDEAKAFLSGQPYIRMLNTSSNMTKARKTSKTKINTSQGGNKKDTDGKSKLFVTKSIQTVKSSVKNRKSEEAEVRIQNLANALKSRNRKVHVAKATLENIETKSDQVGNDRTWYYATWAECLKLYQLAKAGKTIKQDDKDNYLPNKLFGWYISTNQGHLTQIVFQFTSNRMCASTLNIVSKTQQLNENAINKLMSCIVKWDNLIKLAFEIDDTDKVFKDFIQAFSFKVLFFC
jgi:hypothetical protein